MLICRLQAHFGPIEKHRKYQSTDSGSNGPSVAQEPKQDHSRQALPRCSDQARPRQDNPQQLGVVGATGRPADPLVGRPARGPIALSLLRGSMALVPYVGLRWISCRNPVAPCYKYKGVENENTHTHTHTPHFTHLSSSLLHSL